MFGNWTVSWAKQAIWIFPGKLVAPLYSTYQYWPWKTYAKVYAFYLYSLGHLNIIQIDHLSNCIIVTGKKHISSHSSDSSPFSRCSPRHPHLLLLPWRYIASYTHESQSCSARSTLPLVRCYFSNSRSNNEVIITKPWGRRGCYRMICLTEVWGSSLIATHGVGSIILWVLKTEDKRRSMAE